METARNEGKKEKKSPMLAGSSGSGPRMPDYPWSSESERAVSDISQKYPSALGPNSLRLTSGT